MCKKKNSLVVLRNMVVALHVSIEIIITIHRYILYDYCFIVVSGFPCERLPIVYLVIKTN